MSQNNLIVENGSGIEVCADIQGGLQALATQFSGASQPNPIYPYMWWVDTANALIKQANAAGDAFVTKGKLKTDGSIAWYANEQTIAGAAQGDILFVGSDGYIKRLAAGTSGQVLTSGGTSSDISWGSSSSGGGGDLLKLKIANNATTPNSKTDITFDSMLLFDSSLNAKQIKNISLTVDITTNGANGLDTGTKANNTPYYLWLIAKSDGTTAGLWSLSSTAPTMPTDYTYKRRVGWNVTDSSGNIKRILQKGNTAAYLVTSSTNTSSIPLMASGTSGNVSTPTFTQVSTIQFVPSTAKKINIVATAYNSSGCVMVAPNANYGGYTSQSNPCPVILFLTGSNYGSTQNTTLFLEANYIQFASSDSSAKLMCAGWEDDI